MRTLFTKIVRSGKAALVLCDARLADDARAVIRTMWDSFLDFAYLNDDPSDARRRFLLFFDEWNLDKANALAAWIKAHGGKQEMRKTDKGIVNTFEHYDRIVRRSGLRGKKQDLWSRIAHGTKKKALGRLLNDPHLERLALVEHFAEQEGNAQIHSRPWALNDYWKMDRERNRISVRQPLTHSHQRDIQLCQITASAIIVGAATEVIGMFNMPKRLRSGIDRVGEALTELTKVAQQSRMSRR